MEDFRERRRLFTFYPSLHFRLEVLYANISKLFIINRSMYNSFYSSCVSCRGSVVLEQTCLSAKGCLPSTERKWQTQGQRITGGWELQALLLSSHLMRCYKCEDCYIIRGDIFSDEWKKMHAKKEVISRIFLSWYSARATDTNRGNLRNNWL
jgi:hypothetical protein